MGFSSNTTKTSQTNNSTTSGTTTPNLPSYVAGPMENYYGQVGGLISQNWSNPNFLATPTNGLLQAANTNAMNLPTGQNELGASNALALAAGTSKAPTIGDVTKVAASASAPISSGQAVASSLLEGLENYYNPYQQQVVDTTLAGADLESAKQQAALRAQAARGGAFGGSRDSIAQTQLTASQERQRAKIEADLRAAGFDKATAMSLSDAQMRTQVSQSNAANANAAAIASQQIAAENARQDAAAANTRALQQALLESGGLDRMLSAGGLLSNNAGAASTIANNNVATQAELGQSLWNIDQFNNASGVAGLGAIQGLLSGYEPLVGNSVTGTENSSGTGTQTTPGGLFGQLLGIGGQLGSAALLKSERRVKRDIELIDREHDGLGRYRYNYIWDPADEPRRTGVMVDEVSTLRPWALGPIMDGVQTVDYSKLEAR